ncbi:MAG: helix-turn-helix transcriptional regulator [Fimbriimonadaceae bacterium]|nr:helix-turn-helix transcriptional regulator [Fimbriimonadaceae bacterium]
MDDPTLVLRALGDPLRLRLLEVLGARGETCVAELLEQLGTTQANISTHLKVLKEAGLLRSERIGRWVFYSLDRETLANLQDWLRQHLGRPGATGPTALYAACCSGLVPGSLAAARQLETAPHASG